jgi:HD-like signal output (HDOD) protein
MSAAPVLNDDAGLARILARISEMPVLPHVVFKVMEISGANEGTGHELERAIVIDPGFSSRLLSLANSAYYGLPRKVTSVREAIAFLGFKSIRQLAMTVGIFDVFIGKNDKDSLRRRRWWRHSVDAAVCCRWLAMQTKRVPAEEAYTAGLLHYIGKTLLDRFGSEPYEKVELLLEHGVEPARAEQAVYRCDHIQVAVGAAEQWGFPQPLVAALEYLEPPLADHEYGPYCAHVAVASGIADLALQGWEDTAGSCPLPEWALEMLGYSAEDACGLIAEASGVIAEAATIQI